MSVDTHVGMVICTQEYSCEGQRTMLGFSETLSLTIFARLAYQGVWLIHRILFRYWSKGMGTMPCFHVLVEI